MSYAVLLEAAASRDLDRLSPEVRQRVLDKIRTLSTSPRPHGSRKLQGSARNWRIRSGDYRVLYEVDDSATTVKVYRVKHRREAYR